MIKTTKGGYKVADFKDLNISADGVKIPGIYEDIEGSYRKAILASGVTIDNLEYRDTWVDPVHGNDNYSFTIAGKTVTIKSDDTVTSE